MKRKIITTGDGSKTIRIIDWDEQYHSIHGAIQEANHVFINHGLYHVCHSELISESSQRVSILEIGLGTGLNAFITLLEVEKLKVQINYVGIEAYPISNEEVTALNYAELISIKNKSIFKKLHQVPWEEECRLSNNFSFTKRKQFFENINDIELYDLIYFDAFGAKVQPELWTESIFKIMYDALKPKGVLVTYSAKGSVRRAMQSVGFIVERLEGPPGKHEMLRGTKHSA